jgi:hypothetical protein
MSILLASFCAQRRLLGRLVVPPARGAVAARDLSYFVPVLDIAG